MCRDGNLRSTYSTGVSRTGAAAQLLWGEVIWMPFELTTTCSTSGGVFNGQPYDLLPPPHAQPLPGIGSSQGMHGVVLVVMGMGGTGTRSAAPGGGCSASVPVEHAAKAARMFISSCTAVRQPTASCRWLVAHCHLSRNPPPSAWALWHVPPAAGMEAAVPDAATAAAEEAPCSVEPEHSSSSSSRLCGIPVAASTWWQQLPAASPPPAAAVARWSPAPLPC
jgi:hypothetical protein